MCCIASGPSLTKEDAEKIKGHCWTAVVNDNYQVAPWADYLYACDRAWWDVHHKWTQSFERWTQDLSAANTYGLNYVRSEPGNGLSEHPNYINQGGNSGYQVVNLMWNLGFRDIALLGYDMGYSKGLTHWFGDHPNGLQKSPNFEHWRHCFTRLNDDIRANGGRLVNCSRQTALNTPRMMLEDWICE